MDFLFALSSLYSLVVNSKCNINLMPIFTVNRKVCKLKYSPTHKASESKRRIPNIVFVLDSESPVRN